MIRFITILIGVSLTLAAGVRAAQPDPKKEAAKKPKIQKQQVAPKQRPAANPQVQSVQRQHTEPAIQKNVKMQDNNVSKRQAQTLPAAQKNKKNKEPAVQPNPTNQAPVVQKNEMNKAPNVQANTSKQQPAAQLNKKNVKTFHPQHQNFHAQPKSAIASVQFNKNYQINGAQNWNGAHYQVFKSYHPQWHDQGWWHSHHNHVLLIGGGWYYWDSGYWYPAWGYDSNAAYYPYDGPIYSGNNATPLDQVIADVQSALQEQGYYQGEVDGLLGPLTRDALAAYQSTQGLTATAAIDQPTLASLGLG